MLPNRPNPADTPPHGIPSALHVRAIADLRFIRETMAGAASYTAFSGWGLVVVGLGALIAALIAAHESSLLEQQLVWVADAGISIVIGAVSSALKAKSAGQALFAGPIRKFSFSFAPAVLSGAVLTSVMIRSSAAPLLPGVWLLLYGVGLASAGTLSIWVIPLMGVGFFSLGVLALTGPSALGNALLAAGFGGIHIAFGAVIARRHGG